MTATALLLAAPPSADACMWVLTVSIGKTEACSTIPDSEPAIMWSVSWLSGAPSPAILRRRRRFEDTLWRGVFSPIAGVHTLQKSFQLRWAGWKT